MSDLSIKGTHLALAGAFICLVIILLSGCKSAPPTPANTGELYDIDWTLSGNLNAHDPVIIRQGESWYIFTTGTGITMKRSDDGRRWENIGPVFKRQPEWHKKMVPFNDGNLWAPDIFHYKGKYYLYYYTFAVFSKHWRDRTEARSRLFSEMGSHERPKWATDRFQATIRKMASNLDELSFKFGISPDLRDRIRPRM